MTIEKESYRKQRDILSQLNSAPPHYYGLPAAKISQNKYAVFGEISTVAITLIGWLLGGGNMLDLRVVTLIAWLL